ncbi:hypothetical protein AM10699_61860 (plasmid) [Acaryochloris marina MBIC10699]|nr:hypothetical protein AM10699_61860 [Acaryochloris marina MBIC10699]
MLAEAYFTNNDLPNAITNWSEARRRYAPPLYGDQNETMYWNARIKELRRQNPLPDAIAQFRKNIQSGVSLRDACYPLFLTAFFLLSGIDATVSRAALTTAYQPAIADLEKDPDDELKCDRAARAYCYMGQLDTATRHLEKRYAPLLNRGYTPWILEFARTILDWLEAPELELNLKPLEPLQREHWQILDQARKDRKAEVQKAKQLEQERRAATTVPQQTASPRETVQSKSSSSDVAQQQRNRQTSQKLQSWIRAGFSTDEKTSWEENGISRRDAILWRRAGLTPEQARRWSNAGYTSEGVLQGQLPGVQSPIGNAVLFWGLAFPGEAVPWVPDHGVVPTYAQFFSQDR